MTVPLYPGSIDRADQDRTEWNVALAVKAPHLGLPDRREIGRAGIDRDAGQQHRRFEMLQTGHLLHHVLAGQLIAALLQHLNGCRGNRLAVDVLLIDLVATRVILDHERHPRFVARVQDARDDAQAGREGPSSVYRCGAVGTPTNSAIWHYMNEKRHCSSAPHRCREWPLRQQAVFGKVQADRYIPDDGAEIGEFGEEVGEGLPHARGVAQPDAGYPQCEHAEAHCHAVIIVRFNLGTAQGTRIDGERITQFLDAGSLGQFGAQGSNTLAFLDAQATKVCELRGDGRKGGKDNRGHDAVGQIDAARIVGTPRLLND
jgi:hypothetical protein